MTKAKIKDSKIEFNLPENKKYLAVSFDLLSEELDEEGNNIVLGERILPFELDTNEKTITKAIKEYCDRYDEDSKLHEEAEKRSEAEANANEVSDKLKDKII